MTATGTFDQKSMEQIAKAVRQVLRTSPGLSGRTPGTSQPNARFYAKLGDEDTDSGHGTYKWTKQKYPSGSFDDDDPDSGDDFTAHEINSTKGLKGKIVELNFSGYDTDSKPVYYFAQNAGGLFAVPVTMHGGDAGDGSTKCSFTYDWTDPDEIAHNEESPTWVGRASQGRYVAATNGTCYLNGSTWTLYQVDEVEDVKGC